MQEEFSRPAETVCSHDLDNRSSLSRREMLLAAAAAGAVGMVNAACPQRTFAQGVGVVDAELARVQGARRILLKGGVVLTLDPQVGDFAEADVLIEDGRIRGVRPNIPLPAEAAAVIDATNRIVLAMIDAGTTGVVDISQVNHTPEHSEAGIRALQESGIRAVYAYSNGSGPGVQYPQDIVRLQRNYFNSKDQLLTLALGLGLDAKLFALARDIGVPAVAHVRNVLPGRNDAERLLELGRAGLLRPGDEYIHCLHLTDAAWRLIKDSGGRVSLSTAIEMTTASRLRRMRSRRCVRRSRCSDSCFCSAPAMASKICGRS